MSDLFPASKIPYRHCVQRFAGLILAVIFLVTIRSSEEVEFLEGSAYIACGVLVLGGL
jgi:hypothetical protein